MKDEIKHVTIALLLRHGYQGLRFRDIAEQLGVTRANIHHHYGNKLNLCEEVIVEYVDRTLEAWTANWTGDSTLFEKVEGMMESNRKRYLQFNPTGRTAHPWSLIGRMRLESNVIGPRAREALANFASELNRLVIAGVEQAVVNGELSADAPRADIALQLVAIADSAGWITQDGGDFSRLEQLYRSVIRIVDNAYGRHGRMLDILAPRKLPTATSARRRDAIRGSLPAIGVRGGNGLLEQRKRPGASRRVGKVDRLAARRAHETAQDRVVTLVILVRGDGEVGLPDQRVLPVGQSGVVPRNLEGRAAEITDLVEVADLDAAMVAHHLPPLHRCAARLMRAHHERADAAVAEAEIDMEEELAGLQFVPACPDARDLAHQVRDQVEIMHAVMQVEAGVVDVPREVGRRGHVLAEEARRLPEFRRADDVGRDAVCGGVAFHEAHHDRNATGLRGIRQFLRLSGRGGRRLLDEERQPPCDGRKADLVMLLRPHGEADGVDIRAGEQGAPVAELVRGCDAVAPAGRGEVFRRDVADRLQNDIVPRDLRQQHLVGMGAAADPAEAQWGCHHAIPFVVASRSAKASVALR